MLELIKLWISEVNKKRSLKSLLKELCLSFEIKIDKNAIHLTIKNGHIHLDHAVGQENACKKIEGEEETFLSIILGEQKLREAVNDKRLSSTLSYRELLLLESLFILAKPNLLPKFLKRASSF